MSDPQGKHVCCWERENPHRCILCCQCGKKVESVGFIEAALERKRREAKQPNFCFACNGSGSIPKPISEWSESEHEYNACPRTESPTKVCLDCNGTGKLVTTTKH